MRERSYLHEKIVRWDEPSEEINHYICTQNLQVGWEMEFFSFSKHSHKQQLKIIRMYLFVSSYGVTASKVRIRNKLVFSYTMNKVCFIFPFSF